MEIRIQNDLYDIAARLKEIDERYETYFDTGRQKYVIKAFGILQAVIPYDELDQRTLDYVMYTRRENVDKVLKDVDEYNAAKERENVRKVKDEIEDEYSRRLRLSYGRREV